MLKTVGRQLWTCPRCLRAQRRSGSSIASTAAALSSDGRFLSPATFDAPNAKHDDRTLRQVFDSRPFWQEFAQTSRSKGTSAGLVLNRYLARPEGFTQYAKASTRKCSMLVDKTLALDTIEGYKGIVRDLDRLSDLLCRVIDLSDFIRSTHPDRRYQDAATAAYAVMYEYMNELNTTTGLNDQLKKAASIPEVYNSWTEEEKVVAKILMKDFSKSAINLPDEDRRKFVDLANDISEAGTNFVDLMAPETPHVVFPSSRLKGMSPIVVKNITRWGSSYIPSTGSGAATALTHADDPDVRREVYMANRTASKASIQRLETLLKSRSDLAKLAGYESYAHMALQDKMAKSPEAVNEFLQALKADTQPLIQSELQELLELKASDAHSENFPGRMNAWDKDYYLHRLLSGLYTRIRSRDAISAYFSLGTVFQGLSRLFSRAYGIRLVPQETLPGETWHEEVRRLDVIDESGSRVAVIYCDLFSRAGKNPNPAHFTLRCSRAISPEEVAEFSSSNHPFEDAITAVTEGMAYRIDPTTSTLYQLPTIALICDFEHPSLSHSSGQERPTLLPLRDVQTLFHEMGHALHSILGRTTLQNVSGTRCATDLAELPSVLMERFAFAPQVLNLWARHWSTDQKLPYSLVEEQLRTERRGQGIETEGQITMALLDQALHSRIWDAGEKCDSTAIYHAVASQSSLPDPPGTAWQGFFGHLYGYGATYYSYLFALAVANRVWRSVFGNGERACDREAGERMKEEFLKWGGGRDGWKCVAGVLREEKLAAGDEQAMRMVGRWGVN